MEHFRQGKSNPENEIRFSLTEIHPNFKLQSASIVQENHCIVKEMSLNDDDEELRLHVQHLLHDYSLAHYTTDYVAFTIDVVAEVRICICMVEVY